MNILKKIGKWILKHIKRIIIFIFAIVFLIFNVVHGCAPGRGSIAVKAESYRQTADLTGTTWEFHENNIEFWFIGNNVYNINFSSNNSNYTTLYYRFDFDQINGIAYGSVDNLVYFYSLGAWTNQAYRTIKITGGTDVTNSALIAFLEHNATFIEEPVGYTIPAGDYYITLRNPFEYEWGWTGEQRFDISFRSSDYNGQLVGYSGMYIGIQSAFNYISYIRASDGGEIITYTTELGRGWGRQTMRRISVLSDYSVPDTDEGTTFYIFWEQYAINITAPTEEETEWYNIGYGDGYEEGYNIGFQTARDEYNVGVGIWDGMWGLISSFFSAITDLLSLEIVPGFSIGLVVIGIPMSLWVIEFIIKIIVSVFSAGAGG